MNSDNSMLKCSHDGCEIQFDKEFYSSGMPQDKHGIIHHKLLETRLFCMKHCAQHATIICKNSRIIIEDE